MTIEDVRILSIDDESHHAELVADSLAAVGYTVDIAVTGSEGIEKLRERPYDLLVTDLKLGDLDGIDLIRQARAIDPFLAVIVVTGHGTVESAVQAMQQGASDYLQKPLEIAELRIKVEKALEGQALRRRTEELERQIDTKFGFEGIIGSSTRMHSIIQRLAQIAGTDVSVLVTGESGTGKELVAKAIHNNSRRRGKVFVPLNCAALSGGTLESELFGHEKGAFTGATYTRKGRFEHANGGTLFLDEVGDIPLETQVKLLRVVEEGKVTRIGSNQEIPVDVRLISATHRNLRERIEAGEFREDLFYRLNVVTVELPPLRERTADIPLIVHHFIEEYARVHQKPVSGISHDALRALTRHPWPGNVRELKNAVENMVVISGNAVLEVEDLPAQIGPTDEPVAGAGEDLRVGLTIRELERDLIAATLEAVGGNRKEAAKMLGIGERTLYRKITEYELR
ncbi:MAG: sigma-54-dependent transcriptional regulator [Planctomycetota bacterium]